MIRLIILLLLSFTASAQLPAYTIYNNVRVIDWATGISGIYVYQPSYITPVSNIDSFAYPEASPTGTMRRVDLRKIAWGDVFMDTTTTATGTILVTSFVNNIYVDASGGNRTITINPYMAKQIINIKRIDNTANTVKAKMISGNIDGVAEIDINIPNYNYGLFWNGTTTRIQ